MESPLKTCEMSFCDAKDLTMFRIFASSLYNHENCALQLFAQRHTFQISECEVEGLLVHSGSLPQLHKLFDTLEVPVLDSHPCCSVQSTTSGFRPNIDCGHSISDLHRQH